MTLIYLRDGDKVLLLKRRPDKKVQPNVWLGLGGKVEPGEGIIESARREFLEETGLTVMGLTLKGTQTWLRGKEESITGGVLYIFGANAYTGTLLTNCDEGELGWHDIASIPTLEHFAPHQHAFIDHALGNHADFHTSFVSYKDREVQYSLDSIPYFQARATTQD